MTLSTCLSDMTKNSSFLRLWPFSWAIAHSFWILGWFTRPITLSTCFRGTTKNSPFLYFRAVLVSSCPLFWGSVEIYKEYDSLYILERNDKKTHHFCVYGYFCELLRTVLGFWGDLQGPCPWHIVHVWVAWPKTHRFCVLGPFSCAHSFGVLG
jgi:hypothetical protein